MTAATAPLPQLVIMDLPEREATEAYLATLRGKFRRNMADMRGAKMFGHHEAYALAVETARVLYREITEVETALKTGLLPF